MRASNFTCQAIESNKHKAVNAAEGHPFRRFAPQDVELMPVRISACNAARDRNSPTAPIADFCNKIGTFETSNDVRFSVVIRGKPDIGQVGQKRRF